jgi:Ca2+/Na+ antiporter
MLTDYPLSMVLAVCYLALLADGMMEFAEKAGCLMGVPEDLMGLTVTAAGTSLPNLFASVLVARQGLGNMAVSNAFGSNTFNIFIALVQFSIVFDRSFSLLFLRCILATAQEHKKNKCARI